MRIVVCVKQISHTYARTGLVPEDHFLNPEDRIRRVNPYDEAATALAVGLKGELPGCRVVLVTLGALTAEAALRRCAALGADEILRITGCGSEAALDSWSKSVILARVIKEQNAGLVLCGRESLDRQNGQVGAFLGHHLGRPFIAAATRLARFPDSGTFTAWRRAGRGVRERIDSPPPVVVSVDMGKEALPLPTIHQLNAATCMPIQELKVHPDAAPVRTVTVGRHPPRPRPKPLEVPKPELDAFGRIEALLAGSCATKTATMLQGDLETQVAGIMAFLEAEGILSKNRQSKE